MNNIIEGFKQGLEQGLEKETADIKAAVMALDVFCHIWCKDNAVTDDLKFNCRSCDFLQKDGTCIVKVFKCNKAPEYKDFGCMGDL